MDELSAQAKKFSEARPSLKLAYNSLEARPKFAKVHHFLASEDYEKALPLLLELAEQGYSDAEFNLYLFFDPRNPGPPALEDHKKALYWLERAANKGFVQALTGLSLEYYDGRNPLINLDWGIATEWIILAAEQGDPTAQNYLSHHYKKGEGVEKNAIEAYKWQRLSINRINASKNKVSEKKIAEFHLNAIVKEFKLTSTHIEQAEALAKQWEATHPWAYQSSDELDSYSWSAPTDFPAPQEIVTAKPSDSR